MKTLITTNEIILSKPLGTLFLVASFGLLEFTGTNTVLHRLGIVTLSLSVMLLPLKRYMLAPCALLLVSSVTGAVFGYMGPLRVPILTLSALGVALCFRGWWKDRQAKALAERQTHRP